MKITLTAACMLALCTAGAAAQQTELNDATGALTSGLVDPVFGTPFEVSTLGTLFAELTGLPNSGYILILGDLATPANPSTPVPGGESFDLNINGPLTVLADGINGGGALFPLITGHTNGFGYSDFAFPMSDANLNQTYAMQAVLADPASPFGLNFTAAVEWTVVNAPLATFGTAVTDEAIVVNLPTPFTFYGQVVTQATVSTKGVVDFDGHGGVDWTPTTGEMEAGTYAQNISPASPSPSSPMIAAFWDDLETNNGGNITVEQIGSTYVFTWNQANEAFDGPPVGTFSTTVDFTGGVIVTIDHSGVVANPGGLGTICGISAGDTSAATQISQVDLVTGGVVNVFSGTPGLKQTIYESSLPSFLGLADTGGTVMTFVDGSVTNGEFVLF